MVRLNCCYFSALWNDRRRLYKHLTLKRMTVRLYQRRDGDGTASLESWVACRTCHELSTVRPTAWSAWTPARALVIDTHPSRVCLPN